MPDPRHTALRELISLPTARRSLLGALAVGLLTPAAASAKKNRKRRKRRKLPEPNAFGCLDVDVACRGDSSACCSGICVGKKPKRGKKDISRCAAHNTGGCVLENNSCGIENPDIPCGADGFCMRTTGNADFCANLRVGACSACRQDEDCQGAFGAGAACVLCDNGFLCPETGGRGCAPSAA
ncbi:MAG: hypothetical protein M3Z20_12470 [Chloroflexota bacterium]|nr:hypothetical protein [Chloroflexota bacterium]